MRPGDLFRLRNARHYGRHGGWLDETAPYGQVAVVMVLGVEPRMGKGDALDLLEALRKIGYGPLPGNEEQAKSQLAKWSEDD